MKLLFSKFAVRELRDAINYYELQLPGLGSSFIEEIKSASKKIKAHPTAWSVERGNIRKYILLRFPYKLLYSIENDEIIVLAVAHQHRKPDYWVSLK